ncbi:MAG: hypothetical protein V7744_20125 [Pseudomonadales bacterium]
MKISTASVRKWHRKLAIVLGLFFMFQALTGIIAQNSYSLNRLTAPELHKVSGLVADRILDAEWFHIMVAAPSAQKA